MNVPFVNFGQQYLDHKDEYDEVIHKCLNEGKLVLQEQLEAFEEHLAEYLGFKYCVGVGSGTDALTLALKARERRNHTFITSGYTFKATIEAIGHSGNLYVLKDINDNRLLETSQLCVPVHIEGMVSQCENAIIEDACQAIGASGVGYSGTACYSFYPAKILGGFGDGGAVCTNIEDVAKKVKLYRHHWQTNSHEMIAHNSRLDNVQAAFLDVKLKYLDEILERRAEIAGMYRELASVVKLPVYQAGRVWQDYVIEVKEPQALQKFLEKKGIQTLGVGMTPPHIALNTMSTLGMTVSLYQRMIRLPLNETLTDEQVEYVIDKVKEFYGA